MELIQDWVERKVQSVSGSSYRMSIPPSFAEGHDKVEYQQNGEYLIARPAGYGDEPTEFPVPFPEELTEETEEHHLDRKERFDKVVANILQSLAIAGVDKATVQIPDDEDEKELYDEAWYRQQRFAPDHLHWEYDETGESQMLIENGLEFSNYVRDVQQYIDRYLTRPLRKGSDYTEKHIFESDDYGFGLRSPTLDEEESMIDTRWALATRTIGERFYNLQRSRYAKGMCAMYIGKYLEMCVDLVKRLVETIATFEKEFPTDAEAVGGLKEDLQHLFNEGEKTFDQRILENSKQSYNLKASTEDFIDVSDDFDFHLAFINELRQERFEKLDSDLQNSSKAGMLLGQILTLCERLLRFPRSICHVGVGARNVNKVYVETEEKA